MDSVYPFPPIHSLVHSVPGQRRGPVHALPLPSGMTDCLAPMVDVMLLMGLKTSTENLKLKAPETAFLVAVSGNPIRLSIETTQVEQVCLKPQPKHLSEAPSNKVL